MYFLLILLMDFQPGDDLGNISQARHLSLWSILTSSIYDLAEYYRPVILLIAKYSLTSSFSVLPFRIGMVITGLLIFWLAIRSVKNLGVSLFGVVLLVFLLIGSPFTHGTFSWWADIGARHALLAFFAGVAYITAGKSIPRYVAFPLLILSLFSHEIGLAVALLYCCAYLVRREYRAAAGICLLVFAYIALRSWMLGGVVPQQAFLRPQGFFFTWIPDENAFSAALGGRYALLYVYNVVAQFFAVFFAEPDQGLLSFGGWRHASFVVLQTASTILLCAVLWQKRNDRAILLLAALFLLTIAANVLVGYVSPRFRTIVVAGAAHMTLFVWAADSAWKILWSGADRMPRCLVVFAIVLFVGWGGLAALRLADMAHGVQNQGKAYIFDIHPPGPEIDADVYATVKQKYLRDPATCGRLAPLARILGRCPPF